MNKTVRINRNQNLSSCSKSSYSDYKTEQKALKATDIYEAYQAGTSVAAHFKFFYKIPQMTHKTLLNSTENAMIFIFSYHLNIGRPDYNSFGPHKSEIPKSKGNHTYAFPRFLSFHFIEIHTHFSILLVFTTQKLLSN